MEGGKQGREGREGGVREESEGGREGRERGGREGSWTERRSHRPVPPFTTYQRVIWAIS